jgi:penicillin G amidase
MWKKIGLVAGVVTVLLLLGAVGGFLWWRSQGLPQRSGEASLAGLQAPVLARFDRWGVPMVEAGSTADLFAAQGWLHANDRFVQMELGRRFSAGRLAELVGPPAVEVDRWARLRRYPHTARALWEGSGPEMRAILEAYARGVNAWLAARRDDLPPELILLGAEPEEWTPADSLGFVLLMADDLSFWQGRPEEARFAWLSAFGPETVRDLLDDPGLHVPEEIRELARFPRTPGERPEVPAPVRAGADAGPPSDGAPGSNNWALGGSRSASGAPLVANDPHLGLALPGVWYQMHLSAPGYRVAGMTLAGVPGVVIGRNHHLAWAVTNTMLDDHDVFFEQVDDSGTKVLRGERWVPVDAARETILVKDGAPVEVELLTTDRGPLLPADPDRNLPARSLAWTLYEPADPLAAFLHLGRSETVEDALSGLGVYSGPAQNLVLADTRGTVAFTVLGRVPDRRQGDGRLPSPGWSPAYGWQGLRPFDTNPRVMEPQDEYLVTANHDVRPQGYELPLSADFMEPYRAERIVELLQARKSGWTARDMAQLQGDVVSLYARRLVAALEREELSGEAGEVVARLAAWNEPGRMSGDTAALYSRAYHELMEAVFTDEARHFEVPFAGTGVRLLRLLEGNLAQVWVDDVTTPEKETRRQILERALTAADSWHRERGNRYEEFHVLSLDHPLGRVPLVGGLWNRGPLQVPGSGNTVNAMAGRWLPEEDRQQVAFGPSMRWVVDLGKPDAGLAVLPAGQSGHPFDPHYDDQLPLYLAGEARPVPWTEEAVEAATVSRLRLAP